MTPFASVVDRPAAFVAARRRLDAELVRRGLVESRVRARELIEAGRVTVGGAPALKAARQVSPGESVVVHAPPPRYVGRGGGKLEGALDGFELDPSGLVVLDAGASTGGFTDCLLQRGAARVWAVDVGHGQLHPRIRNDERVEVRERMNVRHLRADDLGGELDACVADLSFISLTKVAEPLVRAVRPGGWLVLLVKPQFEAGVEAVSRGRGVITDPEEWRGALERTMDALEAAGGCIMGVMVSPLRGTDGNTEFLLHLVREAAGPVPGRRSLVDGAIEDAVGSAPAVER